MQIDKAIEILQNELTYLEGTYTVPPPEKLFCTEGVESLKLGIEALKRIQRQRRHLLQYEIKLLPGETEK